jgi:DNA/RNA endonuclease G (NUC1)
MSDDRTDKAKAFLAKLLPGKNLESIHPVSGTEAPAMSRVPMEHQGATESAAAKLSTGKALTPQEQFAVEAIIIPDKRPAIDIIGGDYNVVHPLWTHFNNAVIKQKLRKSIASIGRIELPQHPTMPYGGTGFVVGRGLVMTNRHVAEIFCSGLGQRELVFRPGHHAGIDFLQEKGHTEPHILRVPEVIMIHPYWDMALLRVEGLAEDHPSLVLSLRHPEDMVGRDVAVIGYPAFDPRNDASVQNTVFGGVYYIKRLQPGKLHGRDEIESFDKSVSAVTHDSSTLGGNSGSAVVDPTTGQVVSLHFAGVYLKSNYAVPMAELARDPRVVDAGLNFEAGGASSEPGIWEEWWQEADAGEAVAPAPMVAGSGDDGAARPPEHGTTVTGTAGAMRASGDSAIWTIPIEITVRIGSGTSTGRAGEAPVVVSADATEKMAEPFHSTDYATRRGYDSRFLGITVPLPEPSSKDIVARLENGDHVIPYHHFSLAMHRQRRLALFTASNVDGSKKAKTPEPGQTYTRKSLGKLGAGDVEKWFSDPRIPAICQLPDRFFSKDQGAFDKGHLVRREDVAWGATFDEVQLANGDTFHTTNCSPQVGKFNRPDQKSNWGELEKFVFKQGEKEKVVLFAGPVLSKKDPTFVGVDDKGSVKIQIPTQFWKVVVAVDKGKLQSFAFVLRQSLSDVPLEFAVTAAWQRHMVSIAELEKLLGNVRFPEVVRRADQAKTARGASLRRNAGIEMVSASELDNVAPSGTTAASSDKPAAVRDESALKEGPLTFRDHFISLYQSAVSEIANKIAAQKPAGGTEGPVDDVRAKLQLAAERVAQASDGDRTVSHSGAPSPKEESLALEKMSVTDHAQACATLGWQLLQAKVLGDGASEKRVRAQLRGSTCDPLWAQTIDEYVKYYFGTLGTRRDQIYVTPEQAGSKVIGIAAGAKVALIGDWGTGADPARRVLEQVKALNPDVIVHLGDIYYSGTDEECQTNFEEIFNQVFDRAKTKLPPVYTLAGNHDMYCGGVGYYKLIKRLNKPAMTQPASFFCLRTKDDSWQLLAMDTGRHDYSPFSVNDVVTFVEPDEQHWLHERLQEFSGKTILLSHHQLFSAFSAIGKPGTNGMLRAYNPQLQATYDVLRGTGKHIAAWFWGHEHNLCIYEPYNNLNCGRCIGHSAIPVFAADTPYDPLPNLQDPPSIKNESMLSTIGQFYTHGFAMLTLTVGGDATADYFEDLNGSANKLYSETIK